MTEREAFEQIAVVDYCEALHIPVYHVPNEEKRSLARGNKLKRMGMRAGVPDLVIPLARGGWFGLYIEMKYGKNKTTPAQDSWLELLSRNHYKCHVCYGADAAMKAINDYIKLRPTYDYVLSSSVK